MKIKEEWDFGFTAIDEADLGVSKQSIQELEDELDFAKSELKSTNESLEELRKIIMPLLNNLMKNPEKDYIHWPNREQKIKAVIKKINEHFAE
jgi:hypothetical protein